MSLPYGCIISLSANQCRRGFETVFSLAHESLMPELSKNENNDIYANFRYNCQDHFVAAPKLPGKSFQKLVSLTGSKADIDKLQCGQRHRRLVQVFYAALIHTRT